MRLDGRGGAVILSGGDPTAVPDSQTWTAGTAYKLDQVVKVGSGTPLYAICILPHTAAASGLTATGGTLGGTDFNNGRWQEIEKGTITALESWSYETTEETTTKTYVISPADRTTGTQVTTSVTLVVAEDDYADFDATQAALAVSNTMALRLLPVGKGTGRPQYNGAIRVTGESGAFTTDEVNRTFTCQVQGAWVRSKQT